MLKQRVVTALIAIVTILIVVFVLPDPATIAFLGLLILTGAFEWAAFLNTHSLRVQVAYTLAMALALSIAWYLMENVAGATPWILRAGLLGWLIAFVLVLRFPMRFSRAVVGVAGFWVLIPAFVALGSLYLFPQGKRLLMLLLIIVWSADIGAYFVGRKYGRIKLAPKVSPGKSWEGVGGGLALVILVAWAGSIAVDVPPERLIPVAIAIAAISILGDLTVSMFKRNAGLKDSGRLFPGHGGLLDRIDSVSAAAPLSALFLL